MISASRSAGDDPDIEFVEQFAVGRIAQYDTVLHVIDRVGDIDFRIDS